MIAAGELGGQWARGAHLISAQARGYRASRGFTLSEVLIALSLGLTLIAGVSETLLSLHKAAAISADRAELTERARFTSQLLYDEVRGAWEYQPASFQQAPNQSVPSQQEPNLPDPIIVSSPCVSPTSANGVGIRFVAGGAFSCLPATGLVDGSGYLVVDSIQPCVETCPETTWPNFVRLDPGCHPLFSISQPEVRVVHSGALPSDCHASTAIALWRRRAFSLRDYSWAPGDNLPALFYRDLRADGSGFKRAEMLVPGVESWRVAVTDGGTPQYRCEPSIVCEDQLLGTSAQVALLLKGRVIDPAATLLGDPVVAKQLTSPPFPGNKTQTVSRLAIEITLVGGR